MVNRKPHTSGQLWARLRAEAELDRIKGLTSEEVCAEIRADGGDPDAIGGRGAALAAKLLAERALDWKSRAAARRETMDRRLGAWPTFADLPRDELLFRIRAARADARLSAPIVAAFRKRGEADATDEELRALLEEIEALRRLHTPDE